MARRSSPPLGRGWGFWFWLSGSFALPKVGEGWRPITWPGFLVALDCRTPLFLIGGGGFFGSYVFGEDFFA